jgi:uroporphyrinogen decarboxylase
MGDEHVLVRALRGERTERTPVWLMRQAGRTDPEYLKARDEDGRPLEELFRDPDFATTVSLLPRRIGVDGIIFYQDILTPLSAMGAHFVFRPGPQLEKPIDTPEALRGLTSYNIDEHMGFVGETFTNLHKSLDGELPVLGFAGAPFTLLVFILEGGSFKKSAPKTMRMIKEHPDAVRHALDEITEMTIAYLKYQAGAGAAAVQLFESAAFLLDVSVYKGWALPYQTRIFDALKGIVPTILFARDWNDLGTLDAAGSDILSLPASISISRAREALGADRVVQGNLDNRFIINASPTAIDRAVQEIVAEGEHRGHIFNLSHGLLRETPFENVCRVVSAVRETRLS